MSRSLYFQPRHFSLCSRNVHNRIYVVRSISRPEYNSKRLKIDSFLLSLFFVLNLLRENTIGKFYRIEESLVKIHDTRVNMNASGYKTTCNSV